MMYLRMLVSIFALFISFTVAVPEIGILRDWYDINAPITEQISIGFSAQIDFEDKSIPGDPTKMSDGQLINLAKIAYQEMVDACKNRLWGNTKIPKTMMAMVTEGSIYFTSSVKLTDGDDVVGYPPGVAGGPMDYILKLKGNVNTHRNGGCCAEPNGLYFYSQQNLLPGETEFKKPPVTDTTPRIAVWMRKQNAPGNEVAEDPCHANDKGYGCQAFIAGYGLKPVDKTKERDERGQDDWRFTTAGNRRYLLHCPASGLG